VAVVVEGSLGANTEGLFLKWNRGKLLIKTEPPVALALRRAAAPGGPQPTL
jgi:hypothetical protein